MPRATERSTRGGTLVPLPEPGTPAESRERGRAATRARILKAAREIFFRDGFADTNLDEVAARAEVGKGTLYRHFESKAELYVAVLVMGGTSFGEAMEAAVDDEGPVLERLRAIGRFYRRYWVEHPEYFGIFSAVHHQEFIGQLPPGLLVKVREIWETPLRRLEQLVAEGVRRGEIRRCDPWIVANVIWRSGNAAVSALVTPRRQRVIDCSAEALYETTLDMLLRALDKRGTVGRERSGPAAAAD